jgi:hypothetical protein
MTENVKISSTKAREIQTYIEQHPSCKKGTFPLIISGKREDLLFYSLPINLLRYNVFNGRFTVERLSLSQDLGRELDSNNLEDAKTIREILNGKHSKVQAENLTEEKSTKLKKSLKESGQLQPGVITADGYVINGNRRMAAIEDLNEEDPSGKWETLDVVILPDDISEKDVYRLEVGLQMSEETKLDYGPINELLKLREGLEQGLTEEEVLASMFGWEEGDLDDALERLRLIDGFLDYTGETSNYKKVDRMHEYFIDLQTHVLRPAKNEGVLAKEIAKRVNYSYELLRCCNTPGIKMSHWKFRSLKSVFSDSDAYVDFVKRLKNTEPLEVSPKLIYDDFRDAVDTVDLKEEKDEPLKLITKAYSALKQINTENEHLQTGKVISALERLDELVQKLKNKLKT